MLRKRALITGITGQDGSYLAELLVRKGYEVHGLVRRSSSFNTDRIAHLYKDPHVNANNADDGRVFLHYADLTDSSCLSRLMADIRPTEVYNLAAMSHVKVSFEMPEYTADVDALGTLRLLEAIRAAGLTHETKFYQASTSELYGEALEIPQRETTPFCPRSPYAAAKLYAYWTVVNYRQAYGMYAVNGILFNHESPRRGPTFVTRKIAMAVAHIQRGSQETLYLGNLDAKRDWGHAQDYVEGMWRMLQQPEPDDFVLASGETHSVREFTEVAFARAGIVLAWRGEQGSVDEVGVDKAGRVRVRIDPRYFRPTEVHFLLGDAGKAKAKFDWQPTVGFRDLVHNMVDAEIQRLGGGSKRSLASRVLSLFRFG